MSRRNLAICQLAIVLVGLVVWQSADAAERSWTLPARGLRLVSPCAKLVTIEPAAELHDHIEVKASANQTDQIDHLTVNGGAVVTIGRNGSRCRSGDVVLNIGPLTLGFLQTLQLTVRVPVGMAIDIQGNDSTDYHIGAVGGPLTLLMGNSGGVQALKASDLSVTSTGSGNIAIDEVTGKIDGHLGGAGDFTAATVNASATSVTLSGSGDFVLEQGRTGPLTATLHGTGHLHVPVAADVQINASGGDASIERIEGRLDVKLLGAGKIQVGTIVASTVMLQATGNSEVHLGAGTIGVLDVTSLGGGGLFADAAVGEASLNLTGASDVVIPHLGLRGK